MPEQKNLIMLSKDDIDSYELINNKMHCAKQALSPGFIDAADPEAKNVLRDALFTLADYQTLQNNFWWELAERCGIERERMFGLHIDFGTRRVYVEE
ncbi:MAG: hypothetical protein LBQ83_05745 [Candidatus Margulisbacteria bacterium]|jgi:hypothetical protein|nr:hypothetical protein [Candidatus Margulisiibacteriota bacterium]